MHRDWKFLRESLVHVSSLVLHEVRGHIYHILYEWNKRICTKKINARNVFLFALIHLKGTEP